MLESLHRQRGAADERTTETMTSTTKTTAETCIEIQRSECPGEDRLRGIWREESGFLAMTFTASRRFKTLAGAQRWMRAKTGREWSAVSHG